MAWWIGVCLPTQGKWFASCLGRIPHAVDKLSPWAATTEAHASRACTPQQKNPLQWAACPPWLGSSSYSLQLESLQAATKACVCVCSGSVLSDSLQPHGLGPPGSWVRGILQARILELVAIPSSKGSSQPRVWTWGSCITGGFFTVRAT